MIHTLNTLAAAACLSTLGDRSLAARWLARRKIVTLYGQPIPRKCMTLLRLLPQDWRGIYGIRIHANVAAVDRRSPGSTPPGMHAIRPYRRPPPLLPPGRRRR